MSSVPGSGGPRVAVIYYSATGNVHELAVAVSEGAQKEGAEVRLLKVPELAPAAAVASNPRWAAHADATSDVPEATHADLEWADAVALGSPVRFGLPAAQLKQFLDTTGPLWARGVLADKVYAAFTSGDTPHGGQEATLLAMANTFYHWGGFIVPPGYADPVQFVAGNPYGASHFGAGGSNPVDEVRLGAARYLGRRLASVAARLQPVTPAA